MDSKNTIAAIALSSAVIVLWALFFVPEKSTVDQNIVEKEKIEQSGDAPSLEQKETQITISRDDALKQSERIQFENDNIIGSISLKGASIDDLTFKNYKVTLDNEQRVTLLGPRNIKEGYLIDSGFVTSDKNVDVPNSDTIWSIEGNNKLTDGSPIKLSWSNEQGLKFEKIISLDDKYLFTVKQKIINESNNKYDFYSYGQIIRNEIPEIIDFLILLEEQVSKHKLNARPVANVHDEFQYEVLETQAEDFGNLAVDSIINAGKELGIRCPLNGEYKYGNNWQETH